MAAVGYEFLRESLGLSASEPPRPALVSRSPGSSRRIRSWRSPALVVSALDNGGKVSKRRRNQFDGRVPDAVFDYVEIEEVAALEDDASESGR
jgi:hypothetical protein